MLKPETATGMHAHHNLSLGGGEPRSSRWKRGAIALTPAWPGWGRGRAMRRWRYLLPAADKLGWQHGTDLYAPMNAGR
ncbi:hypothetical protein LNP17_18065 [Klebsiella variicola subsp. variicola]|nr:hypothetical protein [Klebsiella variicola subsp. variicola]